MKCPIGTVNFCNGKRRRENEMRTEEPKVRLLRKKEVKFILACSPRTIDRLVSYGKLTRVKVLGAVRYKEDEVQELIRKGEQ